MVGYKTAPHQHSSGDNGDDDDEGIGMRMSVCLAGGSQSFTAYKDPNEYFFELMHVTLWLGNCNVVILVSTERREGEKYLVTLI